MTLDMQPIMAQSVRTSRSSFSSSNGNEETSLHNSSAFSNGGVRITISVMASKGKRGSYLTGPPKNEGILSRVSSTMSQSPIVYRGKQVVSDAAFVGKKILQSTGKAAWIAGTTFLILVVPLIIEMDREQQLNELELQQASLLGTPPVQTRL